MTDLRATLVEAAIGGPACAALDLPSLAFPMSTDAFRRSLTGSETPC